MLDLEPADGRIAVATGIGSGIGAIFGAPLGGRSWRRRSSTATTSIRRRSSRVSSPRWSVLSSSGPSRDSRRSSATPALSLHRSVPVALVRPHRPLGGSGRPSLRQGLLWVGRPLHAFAPAPMGQARPSAGWSSVRSPSRFLESPAPGTAGSSKPVPRAGAIPLWIVLLLPFARILATGLSIGSGGSGGIFGPGIVIGAFLGASVWRLFDPVFPSMGHDPAPYVIVGMMSCFGGISRAPLGGDAHGGRDDREPFHPDAGHGGCRASPGSSSGATTTPSTGAS